MMTSDPVVQQQMERMRAAQVEADGYGSRAMSATRSRAAPGEGFASGFLSQFDASKFGTPAAAAPAANPAQGVQASTGQGTTMASTSGAPGLTAQNTPFAQGIGAGIQAGLSGAQPAQTAGSVGLGSQPMKKLW